MVTIKLEETEIPGAVLSRKVDDSGTAVVTLNLNVEDGELWYDVQEWMDGKPLATVYSSLKEALEEYDSVVRYFQLQAERFG